MGRDDVTMMDAVRTNRRECRNSCVDLLKLYLCIHFSDSSHCTGSIISKSIVLTAAHCVRKFVDNNFQKSYIQMLLEQLSYPYKLDLNSYIMVSSGKDY